MRYADDFVLMGKELPDVVAGKLLRFYLKERWFDILIARVKGRAGFIDKKPLGN